MKGSDAVLRDFLLDAGLVSRGQMDALATENKPLSRALIDAGVLGEDELRRATAHALGVPFVVLGPDDIDPKALMLLPEPLCREHGLAAHRISGGTLEVVLLDLADLEALEPLRGQLGYKIAPRLTARDSLRRALLIYQRILKEKFGENLQRLSQAGERESKRLLETLLRHAHAQRASEVHLESSNEGVRVRYRHGGRMRDAMLLPASAAHAIAAVRRLANTGSKTLPQEGKFKLDLGSGVELSVRVSTIPIAHGEKLVLRVLSEQARGYTLEGLGFHGAGAAAVRAALDTSQGLMLVAGPRGSGRTTLLYTLLDMAHAPERSLASVEEQVAMRIPYVAQTPADPQAGLTMAAALRAALRADPDVVMVDGIGDRDTAALAVAAAARGILVLAGIEAEDSAAAAGKLRAWGIEDASRHIALTIGTGLLRRLCAKQARGTRKLERRHLEPLERYADFAAVLAALKEEELVPKELNWKDVGYASVTGCSECDRGYNGLVGTYEVASHAGRPILTLHEDALYKAAAGITSAHEALRLAEERARLDEMREML